MTFRNLNFQQYERYLSPFGKKVMGNLTKILQEKNHSSKIEFRDRSIFRRNKRVLIFDDFNNSSSCLQNVVTNESFNNNQSPCTGSIDVTAIITTSDSLLKTSTENIVTGEVPESIEMKKDAPYQPETTLPIIEEHRNNPVVSGDICVTKEYIEWDDIIDTQLLSDLNILDSYNTKSEKDITNTDDNFIQLDAKNDNNLGYNKMNDMKLFETLDTRKDIDNDCGKLLHNTTLVSSANVLNNLKILNHSIIIENKENPVLVNRTDCLTNNDNIESKISELTEIKKEKTKRPSLNKITNIIPKKIKNLPSELPTSSYRKQKYTKAVKAWLNNVEQEKFKNDMEFQRDKEQSADVLVKTNVQEGKKYIRKTVQAQLTNKGGVMKFGKPIVKGLLENPKEIAIKESVCSASTKKDKKVKPKFIAPVKSQIPVKNITYNIITIDDINFREHQIELNIKDKEVYMILIFSNDFCQLNSHCTENDCEVGGVMFQINDIMYFWNNACKIFCSTMEKLLKYNTIVCYDGKKLLKHFAKQYSIDVIDIKVKVLDVQIGGNLIDPNNPPENFTNLQKLLWFVPEFTIATECVQQKSAWYLIILGECFLKLRNFLLHYELWNVFVDIEMRVLPIVADMELRGMRVDTEYLESMETVLLTRIKAIERACHEAAGRAFQVNSALQVRSILYEELHLDVKSNVKIRETVCKGEKSTSETMLRSLVSVHPLPKLILEYRHLHKAHATFLAGIANQVKNGIVRCTWLQTAAATGRIACNNPNLQAIPKAPFSLVLFPADGNEEGQLEEPHGIIKFRSVYIPREGYMLLAADFKHIECRVFAHAAADTGLLDALASSDLFRVLAARWLHKSEEDVTSVDRERTKRMVYASLYGAGTRKLMEILDVSYDQTLSIVASFNRTFPSLKSFGRAVVAKCEQRDGRLTTICGRGRTFPNIFSGDSALKSQAERQAINFIVQGSAADLCKMAMVETAARLRSAAPPVRGHLLLQIHDELVWEVQLQDVGRAADLIKTAMEGIGNRCGMAGTLPVALSLGRSWGDMEDFHPHHTRSI